MKNAIWAERLRRLGRFILLVPVAIAVLIFFMMQQSRQEPEATSPGESARAVRIVPAMKGDVAPKVLAFGTAAPARTWRAVAEVGGRLAYVSDELRPGAIFKKGAVLLRIDKADYQDAADQLQAEIDQVKSQIAESIQQGANNVLAIEIEKKTLDVSKSELERLELLVRQNAGAPAEVDAQRKAMLAQTLRLQEVQNSGKVLTIQRDSLSASVRLKTSKLAQAKRDIERTEIVCPFDCRVGEVALELNQFIAAGELLVEGFGIAMVEVEAHVSSRDARLLIKPGGTPIVIASIIGTPMDMVRDLFDVTVQIRVANDDRAAPWAGKFLRIREQLDQQTRTIGIVLGVENTYEKAVPGNNPPLVPGFFCQAELRGTPRKDRVIIPSAAVKSDHVYVVDGADRLVKKEVVVEFTQDGYSILTSGLAAGERLVVSDVSPAIDGMLTEPTMDNEAVAELKKMISLAGRGPNLSLDGSDRQ
jgi:hypothetical protein